MARSSTPAATESAKLKICLVGGEGVGKTSLVRRFVLSEFDDRYLRTVGVVVHKRVVYLGPIEGRTYEANLTVWDVLGAPGFVGRYGDAYLANAAGVLAVCDVTRPETLEGLSPWLERAADPLRTVPTIILANKVDLTEHVRITEDDLSAFCTRHHVTFLETSAKTGQNVGAAFAKLADRALRISLAAGRGKSQPLAESSFERLPE